MRKLIPGLVTAAALALGPATVVATTAPAHAASHVTPNYKDTNWPCAGC